MKLELLNPDGFVAVNKLQPVTNPILTDRDAIPTADGLLSLEIFGRASKDRMNIYSYIELNGRYLHPHVYKIIRRFNREITDIISGTQTFSVDKNGNLVKDENGGTGIDWLYQNWEKISFKKGDSTMRNERIDLVDTHSRDEIFISKMPVIPVHYRDMNLQSRTVIHDVLNDHYAKLIRLTSSDKYTSSFDFVMYAAQAATQNKIVEIYDYFKVKLEKKTGIMRKFLMGKSVDNCARLIITAPQYRSDKPEDQVVDLTHAGLPLTYTCALFNLHIMRELKNYINSKYIVYANNFVVDSKVYKIHKPHIQFSDSELEHHLETFVFNYQGRFAKFKVILENADGTTFEHIPKITIESAGKTTTRDLSWADILYKIAHEVTQDKAINVSRYPITDYYGTSFMKIRIMSTHKFIKATVDGIEYLTYPIIDYNMDSDSIASAFVDTLSFSNMLLEGYGGDYDGDQVTVKPILSQEANKEAFEIIDSLKSVLLSDLTCGRTITNEFIETFYQLTK